MPPLPFANPYFYPCAQIRSGLIPVAGVTRRRPERTHYAAMHPWT